MFNLAILIAAQVHLGQKDKNDAPYILHPLRRMFRFQSDTEIIVAVLHDVIKDAPNWNFERICREGFSEEIFSRPRLTFPRLFLS